MKHYSEQEIELFAFNSETVVSQREAFDRHVLECASCRELYTEIVQFYASANEGTRQLEGEKENGTLIATPSFIHARPLVRIDKAPMAVRAWRFARNRPMLSSFSLCVLLAMISVGIQKISIFSDENPKTFRFNEANDRLEFFTAEEKLLWDVPIRSARNYNETIQGLGIDQVAIEDLDGDGKNEIITSIDMGNNSGDTRTLKVYNGKKKLLFEIGNIQEPKIHFRDVEYHKHFYTTGFKVITVGGKKNIFVICTNGRSPSFVARVDPHGNIIGKFWHFGQLAMIGSIDTDHDGQDEVLFFGLNDVPFPDITFGVASVLDPKKIIGNTESAATKGFGFPTSQGEKLYLRFPRSDIDSALKVQTLPSRIQIEQNTISVYMKTNIDPAIAPDFEYVFSQEMKPLSVKGNDPSARFYENLKKQGIVKGIYGNAYFEQLKNAIEYFNGEGWQKKQFYLNRIDLTKN